MAKVGWYNDNASRQYPLVDVGDAGMLYSGGGRKPLPDSTIVDFTCIIGPEGQFSTDTHRVFLYLVTRVDNRFDFYFRFTAPELLGHELQFCRYLDDSEYATSFVTATDNDSFGVDTIELDCPGDLAEAWLTTGTMADLAGAVADGEYLLRMDAEIYVEPAQVQSLCGAYMRSVNLANSNRTIATAPDICSESLSSSDGSLLVNSTCMQGEIKLKPGYNCTITQDDTNNSITIGGAVGAGEGEPCEEVELADGIAPIIGSTLLSGGPACDEIIGTINGLPGPIIRVISGVGVSVGPSIIDPHTLVVDFTMGGLTICLLQSSINPYGEYF